MSSQVLTLLFQLPQPTAKAIFDDIDCHSDYLSDKWMSEVELQDKI